MSFATTEIASQPDTWVRAARLGKELSGTALFPRKGERVAVTGCGTSYYMAQSLAALREGAGLGETDAFPASEFPVHRRYDRVVVLSRSGTTTEVLQLLEQLAGRPTTAITTDERHPMARLATDTVAMDFADERSVVQTRFATATVAFWRAGLGLGLGSSVADAVTRLATDLDPSLSKSEQFAFLGTGWTIGLANEAALKMREAAQAWAESYPAMEFRHGPISVIDHRSTVWVLGEVPAGLAEDIAATGANLVHSLIDPLAQLTDVQRLAIDLAEQRGLDPDRPRHLTRSIVLAGSH